MNAPADHPGSATKATMAGAAGTAALLLYTAVCFLVIALLALPDYEAWLGPPDANSEFSYCRTPVPYDDTSDMAVPILILLAPLFVAGMICLIKQHRANLSLALSLGLLLYWTYCFFGRAIFC